METYRTFNGEKYELFDDRVSKSSAAILKRRFKNQRCKVRVTKHKPSNSYQVWVRGEGEWWM